jgi:phasin
MSNKDGIPHFEVPADLRAMTEKSMEQARVAFNSFMSAAQQAVSQFEGHAKAVQAGAKDVSEKAMSYAERNVANTFAFADRIVRAKDAQEFVRLQTEFMQAQMKELAEQAKDLGESAAKMAMKSVPPKPKP